MSIETSTHITFPSGAVTGISHILAIKPFIHDLSKCVVITASTPFHPVDYNWPDQPSDRGAIKITGQTIAVENCYMAAFQRETDEFLLDQEIKDKKIRRDDLNWLFLVAHLVDMKSHDALSVGQEVELVVDADYRLILSRSHTACHLASLALNQITASFWKKIPDRIDSFGNPNLDGMAVLSSKVTEQGGCDHYRCGSSLKRQGFEVARFLDDATLKMVETQVNQLLRSWCQQNSGLHITMSPNTSFIHERRDWLCTFTDGRIAKIPCGGTHVATILPTETVVIAFERCEAVEFIMHSKIVAVE